ncbi:hypothetical protein ACFXTI_041480 [Malus domestica]
MQVPSCLGQALNKKRSLSSVPPECCRLPTLPHSSIGTTMLYLLRYSMQGRIFYPEGTSNGYCGRAQARSYNSWSGAEETVQDGNR